MSAIPILLVEDDESIAMLLRYGLEPEGFDVTHVTTLADARRVVVETDFHVAILDVYLPDGSGFDLCREFRLAGMRLPILILTARTLAEDKVQGLELGADDYVEKPFDHGELVARLNALVRRSYGELADGATTRLEVGDLLIDLSTQRVMRNGDVVHLTSTEFKLLAYLAQNPDQPFDRRRLLEEVWGYDEYVGDARTVDVHVRNLRQKIETDPAHPRMILTVRGAGYKLRPPLQP